MKKSILLTVCILYLFAISGIKISVHYCHGKFQTIAFNANQDEDACCGSKRPMKKKGCCDDRIIDVKIKGDQKASSSARILFNSNTSLDSFTEIKGALCLYAISDKVFFYPSYSPPRGKPISILILNNTFRI
jgi:hypothetical protein